MNVNKALKRISWATTSWPGIPIDPDGLAHVINFTGNLNPIIWVFNDENEPRNFSQCFDDNQPIIAFRTLNAIVERSSERAVLSEEISNLYADIIIKLINKPIHLVGGNCQGAPFAMWIAQNLIANGHKVKNVSVIDAHPNIKIDVPVLLNFGIFSKFNPFFTTNPFSKKRKDAKRQCNSFYASYEIAYLPCGHGQYFSSKNIKYLIKNLQKFNRKNFAN
ncbi:hypothetical protein N8390_10635 [Amylibacter sp.]|nr:hypothetical protein [Amylibacter sp.]